MKLSKRQLRDLPMEPVARGVRLLALSALTESMHAFTRLSRSADTDALHDFRVALRRLRTVLRVYRPALRSSIRRKLERRLRTLARASSASRDLEALSDLLSRIPQPNEVELAGIRRLEANLSAEAVEHSNRFREKSLQNFPRMARALQKRVSTYEVEVQPNRKQPAFGTTAARVVTQLRDELRAALDDVQSLEHQDEAHEARIAAKRLRYLLEPLGTGLAECTKAVTALRQLQNVLGELHDAHILLLRVETALPAADLPEAAELTAVRERVNDLRLRIYARIRIEYLEPRAAALMDLVTAAARALALEANQVKVVRRFLLRRFPRITAAMQSDILQGYLRGREITERIRRVSSDHASKYYRKVTNSRGVRRIEIEEETTEAVFKRLFALTRGQRVRKRRFTLAQDGVTWTIDRFLDRHLVIVKVKLRDRDAEIRLPRWLESVLEREVTGDPEYSNERLAQ